MQKTTPFLRFDKETREAAEFYVSVFKDAKFDIATLKLAYDGKTTS